MQTNRYAVALCLTLSAGFTLRPCKTVEIPEIMLLPYVRALPKLTTIRKKKKIKKFAFTEPLGLRHCLRLVFKNNSISV